MKTAQAASPVVSGKAIALSLVLFCGVYLLLLVMFIMLFLKLVRKGPAAEKKAAG